MVVLIFISFKTILCQPYISFSKKAQKNKRKRIFEFNFICQSCHGGSELHNLKIGILKKTFRTISRLGSAISASATCEQNSEHGSQRRLVQHYGSCFFHVSGTDDRFICHHYEYPRRRRDPLFTSSIYYS